MAFLFQTKYIQMKITLKYTEKINGRIIAHYHRYEVILDESKTQVLEVRNSLGHTVSKSSQCYLEIQRKIFGGKDNRYIPLEQKN